ncbi:PepSY-associated TM helix domain-containing protein [Paenibacillus sp. 1P07SE]|uniref:PepSY-associated TM helix domain-containing protein n=1 Tax=Paenibacillus sp. 1P07SE TaxID=3132209 RepID=UPI0039A52FAF
MITNLNRSNENPCPRAAHRLQIPLDVRDLRFRVEMIFAPFIIILAISGSVYLFKPQIVGYLYKDMLTVRVQTDGLEAMPAKRFAVGADAVHELAALEAALAGQAPAETGGGISRHDKARVLPPVWR